MYLLTLCCDLQNLGAKKDRMKQVDFLLAKCLIPINENYEIPIW